ncbi:MAG: insulinase family protein [Calditrichae bacterium]|nr:insulinase family protein [Calditrichota bacterium]MCB9088849.1 insulinase family protein [Calditrichia bacterium]
MIYQSVHKTILPNGLTIVSEHIPYVRSISLGVWVKSGSRSETPENNGVAHFLEHLLFKDTERRSARDVVRNIESLGGMINAYTSKEQTCFHVEILDEHLPQAVDVLADILFRKGFPENEIEKEREVILDEIQSLEDTPDELVQDILMEKLYPGHSLGFSILGTEQSIAALTLRELMNFYHAHYCPGNIIIAAAGNLEHARLVDLAQGSFSFSDQPCDSSVEAPRQYGKGEVRITRPINQAHVCLGMPAFSYSDPRKYDLLVLNTVLGAGMGSRLFQNIRETYGIAYGIYSFFDFFSDNGMFGVYLGTDPKKVPRALELVEKELAVLCKRQIPRQELQEAQSQLKGNIVLGLESTAARMNRLAMLEIYFDGFKTIDYIVEAIDRTTRRSVWETSCELFRPENFLRVVFSPEG